MSSPKDLLNRYLENLAKLEGIRKNHSQATHIYLRRADIDGSVIDIPIKNAEETLKLHPLWVLEGCNIQMDDVVDKLFRQPISTPKARVPDDVAVPPKPSEKKKRVYNKKKSNA